MTQVRHTDFVFSIVSEDVVSWSVVLVLLVLVGAVAYVLRQRKAGKNPRF